MSIKRVEERITRMAMRMKSKPVPLSDIVVKIVFSKAGVQPAFDDQPNDIYLPIGACDRVETFLLEDMLARNEYAQLWINEDVADARYVAGVLNSPLGVTIRERVLSETSADALGAAIANVPLFLPDRETQMKTIEADSRMENLVSELHELRDRLWSQPHQLKKILTELERTSPERKFTDWIYNMPFPTASILWAYHAAGGDHRKQYEHLLCFFEALAELMAVVMLSGFAGRQELFVKERSKYTRALANNHLSITRSSFATWNVIYGSLAKRARKMLNSGSESERSLCYSMFHVADVEMLQALFSPTLIGVLQKVNSLRNSWRGHGGAVSDRAAFERHVTLADYLSKIRQAFSDARSRYQLILPRAMKYSGGFYNITAARLSGVSTPFQSIEIRTTEPLEDGCLYMIGMEESTALKLLPIVKMMPSPATGQDACYYYNRTNRDGTCRFVSYYYEADPEIQDVFPDTISALDIIRGKHWEDD